jgi:antitoxin VapB
MRESPLTIHTNDIYLDLMDTAKLFSNGRSQAVRLPKKYRFRGKQVYVRKFGTGVLLLPEEDSWETLVEGTACFTDDFLEERGQGALDKREGLFE